MNRVNLRNALEDDTKEERQINICMIGPLSDIYTQALNIAYAKNNETIPDTVVEVVNTPTDNTKESTAPYPFSNDESIVGMESIKDKSKDKKNKIKVKVKKGSFHEWLGKKPGDPITDADIEKGLKSDDPHVRKMAQFAKNAKKWNKDKEKKNKVSTESIFDIVALNKYAEETQQIDVAIMQKMANSINRNNPPTDNYLTVFGISKDAVTPEDIVEVITNIEESKKNPNSIDDFVLILDAVTPYSNEVVSIKVEEAAKMATALENIASANNIKVYSNLKDYLLSL